MNEILKALQDAGISDIRRMAIIAAVEVAMSSWSYPLTHKYGEAVAQELHSLDESLDDVVR
jgi:hypothetical protein